LEEYKMFERMIESQNSTKETTRQAGYLLTSLAVVGTIFAAAMLYSLFGKSIGFTDDNFDLAGLAAPVMASADAPAPEVRQNRVPSNVKQPVNEITRADNIARTDEPVAPHDISTTGSPVRARPVDGFKVTGVDSGGGNVSTGNGDFGRGPGNSTGTGISGQPLAQKPEKEDVIPELKKVKSVAEAPKVKTSLGVVNGMARSLPKPIYPAAAKAVHAGGTVNVQVTISEEGSVISATAVTGNSLLRQAAEQAARQAKFTPTLLSKVPVKVTGVIIYNFVNQ
jgi:TonB family protein